MSSRLFLLVLLLAPGTALPRASFDVAHSLNLDQPALRPTVKPVLVERGRAVYVGTLEVPIRPQAQLIRLQDHSSYTLTPPIRAYLRRNPRATWYDRHKARHDLLFHDTASNRSGWLISQEFSGTRTAVYAEWAIEQRRMVQLIELSRTRRDDTPSEFKALGYVPTADRFYCQERRYHRRRSTPWQIDLLRLDARGEPAIVRRIKSKARIHDTHFDPRFERALVTEYAEQGLSTREASGHLVDLRTGQVTRVPLPPTAYGVSFSNDGRTAFAYSNQRGEIWTLDLERGRRVATRRAGRLGHALGKVQPGLLLLIRDHGLEVFDEHSKRRRGRMPMSRLGKRFALTEGSVVAQGQAIIKEGTRLHFVRVDHQSR